MMYNLGELKYDEYFFI